MDSKFQKHFKFALFLLICTNFVASSAFAKDLKVLKVLKNGLVVTHKPEIVNKNPKIYFYTKNQKKLIAIGRILKCRRFSCVIKIKKKAKRRDITKDLYISMIPLSKKRKKKNKNDAVNPTPILHSLALSYGGPLSSSLQLEYGMRANNLKYFFNLGSLNVQLANVLVTGSGLSLGLQYQYYQFNNFQFSFKVILDVYSASLDFTKVDDKGEKEDTQLMNYQATHTASYRVTPSLSLGFDFGLGYNSLLQEYENSRGDKYKIAFSGVLFQTNLFAQYRF